MTKEYILEEDYIELIKLLKLLRIVSSGGEAKSVVENGEIYRNNIIEYRKRAKLRKGDTITINFANLEIIIK